MLEKKVTKIIDCIYFIIIYTLTHVSCDTLTITLLQNIKSDIYNLLLLIYFNR